MRVAVVSCVFPPEPVGSSPATSDVVEGLEARGHHVTVLAPFPNRPSGRLYAGYRRVPFRRETLTERVHVIRCASTFSRRSSVLSRLAENLSFAITSSMALLVLPKPDVIYANTWPLIAAAAVAVIAWIRRVPLVTTIQDLYPESLLSQRRFGATVLCPALIALDRRILRRANAAIAVSEGLAAHCRLARGGDPHRIHVVPNWLPPLATAHSPGAKQALRDLYGVPRDAFLVAYGGNVGMAARVETLVRAFLHLNGDGFHLLVAGNGTSLARCRRLAADIDPRRMHFVPEWDGSVDVLHAADLLVLCTRADQSVVSLPSKLTRYLFSGRPVLALALPHSDTALVVRDSGVGAVVPPDNPPALAQAIAWMRRLPADRREQMGKQGRTWAMSNLSSDTCLPKVLEIVENASR